MTEDIGRDRLINKRQRGFVERQRYLGRLKLRGLFWSDLTIGTAGTAVAMIAVVITGIV